jgi:putative ABC transport system ATP-binding protein
VAIARALATAPAIVLADEPTGALDSKLSAQVISLMRELNRESGQTFVIVTHDAAVAAQTTRTVSLADGRVEREVPDARPITTATAGAASLPLAGHAEAVAR